MKTPRERLSIPVTNREDIPSCSRPTKEYSVNDVPFVRFAIANCVCTQQYVVVLTVVTWMPRLVCVLVQLRHICVSAAILLSLRDVQIVTEETLTALRCPSFVHLRPVNVASTLRRSSTISSDRWLKLNIACRV